MLAKRHYAIGAQSCEKKANEFLTDLFLSKFAGVLGGLDAIEYEEVLARTLQRGELLKRGVMRRFEAIAPYVRLVGLVGGGVTVAKVDRGLKRKQLLRQSDGRSSI